MPPTPFPFQLGIGTDIVHRSRIQRLLLRPQPWARERNLKRYLVRFLTYRESREFWHRFETSHDLFTNHIDHLTRYLAGRWAAKEAAIKACQWRKLSFKHIQILRQAGGAKGRSTGVYALILERPASAYGPAQTASGPTNDHEHHSEPPSQGHEAAQPELLAEIETTALSEHRLSAKESDGDFVPAEMQNDDLSGQIAKISISHDGEYATAVCLAAEQPAEGDVGGEAVARGLR